ncbi:hypothetical protein JOE26_000206 [Rhodococcus coprophilus]|uniref:Uncharacterized protein n=1 Tax=Rhodococcus coprophilus TaxID=38310 RepID=A0A2X4TSU2_9NOCA|nr:hypothetical protein [Rhodococcus coprophilus]SQI29903.1 Uncharacterised protein [Rhodococcus coprophilus]
MWATEDVRERSNSSAFTVLRAVKSARPLATAVALRSSQSNVKSKPAFFHTAR